MTAKKLRQVERNKTRAVDDTPWGREDKAFLAREVKAIRRLQERVTASARQVVTDLIEMGRWLEGVKKRVGHGHRGLWLKKNFALSADTAQNYVHLYRLSCDPQFRSLRNLPLTAARIELCRGPRKAA